MSGEADIRAPWRVWQWRAMAVPQRPSRPTLSQLLDEPCEHCGGRRKIVDGVDVFSYVVTLRCARCGAHEHLHYAPGEIIDR